jgi:phosphatidylglycerol---prolipoprotein diacylglyceryl transferase
MTHFLSIVWNQPDGFKLGPITLHYYSLGFVIAFGLGWYIMKKIFDREGESNEKLDKLFIYTLVATLLGARLGQVFFYDWPHFREHPEEILLPFKFSPEFEFTGFRGLASHGAAIAIILAVVWYSKKVIHRPILWVLDRIVIPVTSGGIFVRIGNFFNSEILGKPTDPQLPTAVKFVRGENYPDASDALKVTGLGKNGSVNQAYDMIEHSNDPQLQAVFNGIPYRHPAQLYEAFLYIFVFAIIFFMYWKTNARKHHGLIFGVFMVLLWAVRFVVEYVKQSQGGFEGKDPILSTGQWLSIPFILIGFWLIATAKKRTETL